MNVNPFSYLIEKLKSKVSKSGDTMTGDLTVDTGTSTDSVVVIGGSQNYGALRLKAGTTGKQGTIITAALTANRNYILPDKGGTVALTSDIRHWSSSDWVGQNSTYTFTELTQGSFLVTVNGYDGFAEGLVLAQRFYNGYTNIVSLNSATQFSVSFNSDNQLTVSLGLAQGVVDVTKL